MKKKIIIVTVIVALAFSTIVTISLKRWHHHMEMIGPTAAIHEPDIIEGPEISSVTSPDTGIIEVQWYTNPVLWDGYILNYSETYDFKWYEYVTITDSTIMSTTIENLTSGKTYYVKLQAYNKLKDYKVYLHGTYWSEIQSVTVK